MDLSVLYLTHPQFIKFAPIPISISTPSSLGPSLITIPRKPRILIFNPHCFLSYSLRISKFQDFPGDSKVIKLSNLPIPNALPPWMYQLPTGSQPRSSFTHLWDDRLLSSNKLGCTWGLSSKMKYCILAFPIQLATYWDSISTRIAIISLKFHIFSTSFPYVFHMFSIHFHPFPSYGCV